MDKNDGRIIVLVLAVCARIFNFMAKFFFSRCRVGYYVDHCATGLQQIRFIPSFLQARLDAIRCRDLFIYSWRLYSAKTLHWIKMKTIEVDDDSTAILPATLSISARAHPTFSAYVEIFRRITACCSGDERGRVASPAIVEAKPVKTIKDKVAQCVNFCFRMNTQSKSERSTLYAAVVYTIFS